VLGASLWSEVSPIGRKVSLWSEDDFQTYFAWITLEWFIVAPWRD